MPIFQVEKYLEKCISSILAQTHQNLEIILVDDGSTDNSPVICDKYKIEDTRVKVIHKGNGGLAQARNIGLKLAKGNFIGFVDSDDWIEPNMYKVLLSLLLEFGADIAVCSYKNEPEDLGFTSRNAKIPEIKLCSSEDAMREVINEDGYIKSFVWNKLYKKAVLLGISFPEGRIYEDTLWTAKIIGNAKTLVCIDYSFYHYLYRDDSLSHNDLQLNKRIQDIIEMNEQRIEYLHENFRALEKTAIYKFQNICFFEYFKISKKKVHFDKDGLIRHKLHQIFCQFGLIFLFPIINFKITIGQILFWISPLLFLNIYFFYKKCKNLI